MEQCRQSGTLGVVVLHEPGQHASTLPAVRDLLPQVDGVLLVRNGRLDDEDLPGDAGAAGGRIHSITFEANRGTAAAWNAAVSFARERHLRYLYLLDQDSVPSATAVTTALDRLRAEGLAAVVQPAAPDRLRLDRFPWNTVASGSLLDVEALHGAGGFDERLFVDEVDHEMLARLMRAGHEVRPLDAPTIRHQTGFPRPVRILGRDAVVSGHGASRRRLQGHSAGLLVRRYAREAPATAARLALRHALTATKDITAGEPASARALVSGFVQGAATGRPPRQAAQVPCPYCEGPLLGRFAEVPDWLFGTGAPGDVYRCAECGALAAGRVPAPDEVASWYSEYYTHATEAPRRRLWSRFWPTPRRRAEQKRLQWYLAPPGVAGRLLDVGTGAGERLVQFAAAGWDVVGQDLDPKAGHLARERGIEVHHRPVADLVGTEKPFDLIGLSHVLEHTADPAGLLQACAALLAPGGRICVISPNADGLGRVLFGRWWFGLDQPRHLAIPTLESLERLACRLGLDAVHAQSAPTNAAVLLGGSLARSFETRLPPGPLSRGAAFSMHLLGQAMGRAATRLDRSRGEEVVWVGRRRRP